MKKKLFISLTILATALTLAGCGEQKKYDKAVALFQAGEYEQAKEMFAKIPEYEDATAQIEEIENLVAYNGAQALYDSKDYESALEMFKTISEYRDSKDKIAEITNVINYNKAVELFNNEEYEEAFNAFSKLGDYEDAAEYVNKIDVILAKTEAEELIAAGDYEGAIALYKEYNLTEEATEITYNYASKLMEEGNEEEAYYKYAEVIDYKDSLKILEKMRNAKSGVAESFTDDYGTTFIIRTTNQNRNELGVSLRFFRNDLIDNPATTKYDDYAFSDSMEREWAQMTKHANLVLDGTKFLTSTCDSGIPYCDLKGELGTPGEWACWLNFNINENTFINYDSVLLYYDDVVIYDFLNITPVSAKASERESVYEKAVSFFDNGEYYAAKIQFSRLFNYNDSDAYLDLLNTYYNMKVHKKLGYSKQAAKEEEYINQIISDFNITFEY